jgi:hypothetical protein
MSSFTNKVIVQDVQDVQHVQHVPDVQDVVLVDTSEPSPKLIEYSNQVKEIIESGHFPNDLLRILGSNKSMFKITNGGRKKSNRQGLIRRSTIKRKQKGGEKSMLTQLLIGIFVGTAMLRIGQVDFGQVMEWIRTNPNFYYTSIFSVILSKFPEFTRELYVKAVTKKLVDMISSDMFLIGSVTNLYNMFTFGSGNFSEESRKCLLQIANRIESSHANVFKFVSDSLGSVTVDLKCPILCR